MEEFQDNVLFIQQTTVLLRKLICRSLVTCSFVFVHIQKQTKSMLKYADVHLNAVTCKEHEKSMAYRTMVQFLEASPIPILYCFYNQDHCLILDLQRA